MASRLKLSKSEQLYIIEGIEDNQRLDGRELLEYRDIQLETSVLRGTHGSARVRQGDTEVLCGVRFELMKCDKSIQSLKDLLEFTIDCSPNASPDFQGRGGDDIAIGISDFLSRAWNQSHQLLKNLVIVEERYYWKLYIDLLILECGGTLLDACGLASHAALKTAMMPNVEIEEGDGFEPEIMLDDDCLTPKFIEGIESGPIVVTMYKVASRYIVDPSLQEECCSSAQISIAVSNEDTSKYLAIQKSGNKSLDPSTIKEMLSSGKDCYIALRNALLLLYKNKRIEKTTNFSSLNSIGYMNTS